VSFIFSETTCMCQFSECAQPPCQCLPFQTSEMCDTHGSTFISSSLTTTPRSQINNLQDLNSRKIHNVNRPTLWYGWHDFKQHIVINAIDDLCKHIWVYVHKRMTFLIFTQLDYRYYNCTFQCASLVIITSKFMLLCWISEFHHFWFFTLYKVLWLCS